MSATDERDRKQGLALISRGWAGRDVVRAAWLASERSDEHDLCAILIGRRTITHAQASTVREAVESGELERSDASSALTDSFRSAAPPSITATVPDGMPAVPRPPRTPGPEPYTATAARGLPAVPPQASGAFTSTAARGLSPVPSPAPYTATAARGLPAVPPGSGQAHDTRPDSRGSAPGSSPGSRDGGAPGEGGPADADEARERCSESFREVLELDPSFSPHADFTFEITGKLGEGGMGVVHRVRDKRLDREGALKLIHERRVGKKAIERFRREARIMAKLDHPSIPPVYEAGTNARGEHYLLMRIIQGRTLGDEIKAHHEAPTAAGRARLLDALARVGEALACAHEKGIVHRDLKPDNVMVGEFGEVMVLDWGLATELGASAPEDEGDAADESKDPSGEDASLDSSAARLTRAGRTVGTPGFMAPEQAEGHATPLCDVFSLGVLLTEALTGRQALEGKTLAALVAATRAGHHKRPRELDSSVPRDLDALADKALQVNPEERIESARAFVRELRLALSGEPLTIYSYSPLERATRFVRRHPGGVAAILASILLVATLTVTVSEMRRARSAREAARARIEQEKRQTELAEEKARQAELNRTIVAREAELAKAAREGEEERRRLAEESEERVRRTLEAIAEAQTLSIRRRTPELIRAKVDEALEAGGRTRALLLTAAQIYERSELIADARRVLEEIVRRFERAYDALFYLHRLEVGRDPLKLMTPTKFLRQLIKTAEKHGDENEFTHFSRGCRLQAGGKLKEAMAEYEKIEQYTREFFPAWVNRGVIQWQLGDSKAALAAMQRALELNPSSAKVLNNRGYVRYELKDYKGSLADYTRAIELEPELALAWANRAKARAQLGEVEPALADARQAVRLAPRQGPVHGAMGSVYRILGRFDESLKCYDRAVGFNERHAILHRNRGEVCLELGKPAEALNSYRRFLQLAPTHPDAPVVKLKVEQLARELGEPESGGD